MHFENIFGDFGIFIIHFIFKFIFPKYFDFYVKILKFEIWIWFLPLVHNISTP